MLTIGDKFPSFDLKAVVSTDPKKAFTEISSESDAGKWKIVFFWPKDFTFICPTEIAAFGKLTGEFNDRDAVVFIEGRLLAGKQIDNGQPPHAERNAVIEQVAFRIRPPMRHAIAH